MYSYSAENQVSPEKRAISILFLDPDRFKMVEDNLDRAAGIAGSARWNRQRKENRMLYEADEGVEEQFQRSSKG